jgi:GT2 family glycosyltransferase/glycosyltransferase involved in cell wall biosynthesis
MSCPLVAIAADVDVDALTRIRCCAVAHRSFGDPRAAELAVSAAACLNISSAARVQAELAILAPDLLEVIEPFIAGTAARRPGRSGDAGDAVAAGAAAVVPVGGAGALGGSAPPTAGRRSKVSIVMPVFNKAELTLQCIQSLARTLSGDLSFEIIVVDNGSTDSTAEVLSGVAGDVQVLRNTENVGFGPACNQAAGVAEGDQLLFLNNDTILLPGWLDPLLDEMARDPQLGAVQPRLVYPDGRLAAAGGLVFAGGDAWVYGRGHAFPDAPQFSSARAPDYASGACLLVRRSAFCAVGGFDDRYAPAYYEDTDLSFSLSSKGYKILYEPRSVVVHIEGGTAGVDVSEGLKRHQVRNKKLFAEKWDAELAGRPVMDPAVVEGWAHRSRGGLGPGENAGETRTRRRRIDGADRTHHRPGTTDTSGSFSQDDQQHATGRKSLGVAAKKPGSVLAVAPCVPAYDRESGSCRFFHLLKCLREHGHEVALYAAGGGERRYAAELGRYGIVCYGVDDAGDGLARVDVDARRPVFKPTLVELCATRKFDTVLITPWAVAEATMSVFRFALPAAEVMVDATDVEYLRLERAAELHGDESERRAVQQLRARELATYTRADRVICVSQPDAERLLADRPGIDVAVVPNAHDPSPGGPGFDQRSGACFVGNFVHPPNRDAVEWWIEEIAPLLEARVPSPLVVVGNDPEGWAGALDGDSLKVTGWVPSTLPWLNAARVSVAPLRYGAGMKGKVGEAMAAGLPVVGTPIAFEGIDVVDGRHALIAETPSEIADALARLHTDRPLWERLSANGKAFIEEHFSVSKMRDAVGSLW